MLTRDVVDRRDRQVRRRRRTAFLADADLADQVELVKLSPTPLSLEEMSKLWGVLGTPYLLSLTYTATVVLIEADVTPTVRCRCGSGQLTVTPAGAAADREPRDGPAGSAIPPGTTLGVTRQRASRPPPARPPSGSARWSSDPGARRDRPAAARRP